MYRNNIFLLNKKQFLFKNLIAIFLFTIKEMVATTVKRLEQLLNCKVQDWYTLLNINLIGLNITSLPDAVSGWTSAIHIYLQGNQLTSLPDAVSGWSSTRYIYLYDNQLTSLPDAVSGWISATTIYLYSNQLTLLPDSVRGWTSATHIRLDDNQLTSLPDAVKGWTSATHIRLDDNQLTSLPDAVSGWTSATDIHLRGNPILFVDDNLCDKCMYMATDLFFSLENKKKIQDRYACKIQKIYRNYYNEKRNNAAVIIQREYIDHFYRVNGPWYNKTLQTYLTFNLCDDGTTV
uniref:Leucine rich repeat protein n=1 Tax=Marseillevirus LCMAC201 TaxID=2506605 RepID=A0A481YX92_9VIRU|nr:MAG: hypothetical protein LCMAC201_03150 [Marseillevirus LCMAC201]